MLLVCQSEEREQAYQVGGHVCHLCAVGGARIRENKADAHVIVAATIA
jgi:hypothetical protein